MKKIISILLVLQLCCFLLAPSLALEATLPNAQLGREVAASAAALSAMADTSMKVEISAKASILMEASSGQVLMAQNEKEKLYPASVTKIMSMLLVCEAIESGQISLTDRVAASENACSMGESQIWLEPGEEMSVDELLKATAVYSANDACTLLGEYVAGSEEAFVERMNARAKELGMNDTHFVNCTGLDDTTDEHLTTAYDIALMARELIKHPIIKEYSTIWMDSLRGGETQLVNTNKLVRSYKGITGLKTGTTDKAGCCVCATAERDGLSLIAVVMGSENSNLRFEGAKTLLDWGFSNYECFTPTVDRTDWQPVRVIGGTKEKLLPDVPEMQPVLLTRGEKEKITCRVTPDAEVSAPVEKGQRVGTVEFLLGDDVLCEYPLLCQEEIPKISFWGFLRKIINSDEEK